ncbi:MAG: hypothetical protein R3C28_26650 [Pirellulaceae bacterium]
MHQFVCSGWWEQEGLGRQSMDNLRLTFANGQIQGCGTDIVGDFELNGWVKGEEVFLRKQYLGQHQLDYLGNYDGEGVYFGVWTFGRVAGGRWLIRIESGMQIGTGPTEIGEL